jgi:AraC-like DNA-binding protein
MVNYDVKRLQELLEDFYNLTHIKICIYDSAERELYFYPQKLSPFCALLRQNEELDEKCKQCDAFAFAECKRTHAQHTYTCHAGLVESICPVVHDGTIVGYILAGQIKSPNTDFNDLPIVYDKADEEKLKKYYEKLPSTDLKIIHSALRVLNACTGYEYLKAVISSSENAIDSRISAFVNENLTGDLSVQKVCSKFHLSRSELYSVFKEYFCTTPAEYIKSRRLHKSCELLKSTNLPVGKIAQLCGIPDYNYFSKIFKRQFGVSPRLYRKRGFAKI